MSLPGINLPNEEFRGDDWERIKALSIRDYVDLHHFRSRWKWIKQNQPDARIHARIDNRGSLDNVDSEADGIIRIVKEVDPEVIDTLTIRNELQHPVESANANASKAFDWMVRMGTRIKTALPDVVLLVTPQSPGLEGHERWDNAAINAAGAVPYDGISLHAYGSPNLFGERLQLYRSRWEGYIAVTEYNFGAGNSQDLNEYCEWLPEIMDVANDFNVSNVCLFIWHWANVDWPGGLPTTVDIRGTPMEQALKDWSPEDHQPRAPIIGEGFMKTAHLVDFMENEIHHANRKAHQTSMAIGRVETGYSTYRLHTNMTVTVTDDGRILTDWGNWSKTGGKLELVAERPK